MTIFWVGYCFTCFIWGAIVGHLLDTKGEEK